MASTHDEHVLGIVKFHKPIFLFFWYPRRVEEVRVL